MEMRKGMWRSSTGRNEGTGGEWGGQRRGTSGHVRTEVCDENSCTRSQRAHRHASYLRDGVCAHDRVVTSALTELVHIAEPVECAENVCVGGELCQTRPDLHEQRIGERRGMRRRMGECALERTYSYKSCSSSASLIPTKYYIGFIPSLSLLKSSNEKRRKTTFFLYMYVGNRRKNLESCMIKRDRW